MVTNGTMGEQIMKSSFGMRLNIEGEVVVCRFLHETAPQTCSAISNILPYESELHYAKIAGKEVFFGIPLILSLEHASEVRGLSAGSVAYWPDRRVFCIYYGPPQEEAARVTVFAKVTQNMEGLCRVGEAVRVRQGHCVRVELEH
jgi:hypothetical protein